MSAEGPDALDPELINRLGEQFGVEGVLEATVLANQLQLQRLQATQARMLDVLEEGIAIDVPPVDVSGLDAAIRQGMSGDFLAFPENGSVHYFPAAPTRNDRITFHFDTGEVDIPTVGERNMSIGLDDLPHDENTKSIFIWADSDISVYTFDERDAQTGAWENDQIGFNAIQGVRIERMEIESQVPFGFRMAASTGPLSPIQAFPTANHQSRYGHITTSATDFTGDPGVVMDFVGPAAANYGVADLNEAVSTFGLPTLHTDNIAQQLFLFEEVSGNADAEVQVREWNLEGEQMAADNDIHGNVSLAATNFSTVSSGDFLIAETDINTAFKEVRVQSSDGSEIELRTQYRGFAPSMR